MRYGLSAVMEPRNYPVTLTTAKTHCGIYSGDTFHDTYLRGAIEAATQRVQLATGRQLITSEWDLTLDCFPSGNDPMPIPLPPLRSITHIKYVDAAGVEQTMPIADYIVSKREPGRVTPAFGKTWPATRKQADAVTVRFVAGYGNDFAVDDVELGLGSATTLWIRDSVNLLLAEAGETTTSQPVYVNGDIVTLSNHGGLLPAGVSHGTTYYMCGISGSIVHFALVPGGTPISMTSAGTGTHVIDAVPDVLRRAVLMIVAHYFDHRDAVITGTIATELPETITTLLEANAVGDWFVDYGE